MIRKLLTKLALFLPIPLFVVALNYTVDPSHLFIRGEYEQGIANILLAGQNVADAGNHDERLVQKYYVKGLSGKKDVIVLGSSRSAFIGANLFPGRSFFNSSVSAATLEDFMAIYGVYRKYGKIPDNILLSLDPWILDSGHPYNDYTNWDSLPEEYITIESILSLNPVNVAEKGLSPLLIKQLKSLFSVSYFVEAFKFWMQGKQNRAFGTDKTETEYGLKLSDGSTILDKNGRAITVQQVRALATSVQIRNMQPFRVEPHRKAIFEAFIQLMHRDGVTVSFLLLPYHPLAYEIIINSTNVNEIQKYFVQFAKENKIDLIGSYNPADYGCGLEDFDDSSHPKLSCIEMTFEK